MLSPFWCKVFFEGSIFLGGLGWGSLFSIRASFLFFCDLWGLEEIFSQEHIASIMMHPVSKICLCLAWRQNGGENLSSPARREQFSVPCGKQSRDAEELRVASSDQKNVSPIY